MLEASVSSRFFVSIFIFLSSEIFVFPKEFFLECVSCGSLSCNDTTYSGALSMWWEEKTSYNFMNKSQVLISLNSSLGCNLQKLFIHFFSSSFLLHVRLGESRRGLLLVICSFSGYRRLWYSDFSWNPELYYQEYTGLIFNVGFPTPHAQHKRGISRISMWRYDEVPGGKTQTNVGTPRKF